MRHKAQAGADLGRGSTGCSPPPASPHPTPWDNLRLSNTTGILSKRKKNYVVYWCWSGAAPLIKKILDPPLRLLLKQHNMCYLSLFSRYDRLIISNVQFEFGVYCGLMTGRTVLVNGSYVVIRFHSDANIQQKGFLLVFTAVQIGKYKEWTSTAETWKMWSSTIFLNKCCL